MNSPLVDAYIEKSKPFAQPILVKLRALVHEVCPTVDEKIKWSFPCFEVHGEILCSMSSFKEHCSFGFWKASLLNDHANLFDESVTGMGHLGKLKSLDDLPSDDILKDYIFQAVELNKQGIKVPKLAQKSIPASQIIPPQDLLDALALNAAANDTFYRFSPSHRKEYIVWINDAKTEKTRLSRIEKAVAQMAEGKDQNWKYKK